MDADNLIILTANFLVLSSSSFANSLFFIPSFFDNLASVGGCLKRLNTFAEGDSFYFYPKIISESRLPSLRFGSLKCEV